MNRMDYASMRNAHGPAKLAAMLLAGCSFLSVQGCKDKADSPPVALVTVQAEHPEVGEISERITADATLSPLAQAAISPRISAPVLKFYVQRGSQVKAGDLLAVLENRDLTAQAQDAKGQYTAAEAAYDQETKAQVQEEYRKAELDVAQAKAQLQLQESITASREKLFKEGAIAGREYDTAAAALVQARSAYDVAENHFTSLQKVSQEAALKQAQGQLASAKGKYMASQAQVSYSEIRSPIKGVVTDRPLFAGETVSAGSPLLTVMDTSALLAKVHLAQIVTQRLKAGDDASVTLPGIDEPIPAKISLISPALDPGSTTVEVWLRVENKSGKYKAGTPARTSIAARSVARAVKVPVSAILTGQDGSKFVMAVGEDGAAHKKAVQLGISDGQDIQVTKGLAPSDLVITTGAYGLEEGIKVQIGKAEESGDEK